MKTLSFGLLSLFLFNCHPGWAGTLPNLGTPPVSSTMPAPTAYAVVARDGNSQVWQRTTYEATPAGRLVPHVHRYTELALGLNHLVNNQWVASQETITLQPDGTAAAVDGPHQAYFPADIDRGALKVVTAEGQVMRSRPVLLCYVDGPKRRVL